MRELEGFLRLQNSETTKKDYAGSILPFFEHFGINNIEDINEAKAAAEMKKQQELQELREKYDIFRNNVSLQFR